jgi:hypothetical protein
MASPRSAGVAPLSLFGPSVPTTPTMASADFSPRGPRPRRPFRRPARSPRVRASTFSARLPDLRGFPWSRELCDLMPARPGPPRLLSGFCSSAHGFASRFLQLALAGAYALRFASVPVTKFREDLHLLVNAHAGHTMEPGAPAPGTGLQCRCRVASSRGHGRISS